MTHEQTRISRRTRPALIHKFSYSYNRHNKSCIVIKEILLNEKISSLLEQENPQNWTLIKSYILNNKYKLFEVANSCLVVNFYTDKLNKKNHRSGNVSVVRFLGYDILVPKKLALL